MTEHEPQAGRGRQARESTRRAFRSEPLKRKEETMRVDRVKIVWSAGGLAAWLLAAPAWAQTPVPPTGPAPCVPMNRPGPLRRAADHTWRVLQDNFIGYPSEFVEPPVGFYLYESLSVMRAKADPHRFTLYRSDFLDGTDRLSPAGAGRFNIMAARLAAWPGPLVVEWTPDMPGLAEARKKAVLAYLQQAGRPVIAERVVVGPSPYPGMLGTDAANLYNVMITRDQAAPATYSLTPMSAGSFSSTGSGGTP
jgi:hypothetical protein